MDTNKLASGDNTNSLSPKYVTARKQDEAGPRDEIHLAFTPNATPKCMGMTLPAERTRCNLSAGPVDGKQLPRCEDHETETGKNEIGHVEVTPQMIEDNEAKMKERIAQCKNIIESLKIELNEEKAKFEKQSKNSARRPESASKSTTSNNYQCVSTSNVFEGDLPYTTEMYSECVDSKLNCDENLMEYEKQLKKYQNTLNLAQIEKKNAIRKQMLSKAYRLKLLEVENQCNIELLRVKQSLQCLEPLQIIASKWTTSIDEMYDINNFELIPRYPELNANSSGEIASYELEIKAATERIETATQDDSLLLD